MRSILKFLTVIIISGLLLTNHSFAQELDIKDLSLQEALEHTVSNNNQIKIANYEFQSAQTDVDHTKSFKLPQVNLSVSGSLTNLPLNAFGNSLQQGSIEQSDFIPRSLNDPETSTNIQSQFMIQQPILNLDMKERKEAIISTSKSYEQQAIRTKNRLQFQVQQSYLNLQLTYEVEKVLLSAKKTAEANLKLVQDNIDAGYLQRVDELTVALRINQIENQLFEARSNIQFASDQLSNLMGKELGTQYSPSDQLSYNEELFLLESNLPLERSDIKAMEYRVVAQEHMLKSTQQSSLPRIHALGSYEINNSMDFSESQHGYMAMVIASWNVFNGNKNKNAIQKAQIELEKSKTSMHQMIAKNELELKTSKRKILEAINNINLSEKRIAQSKEYLRIKADRFEEGLEKTTDLLLAETEVAQSEMNYVEAIYQYNLMHAQLSFLLE